MQEDDDPFAVHVEPQLAVPPPPEPCPECGGADMMVRHRFRAFHLFAAITIGIGYAVDNTLAGFLIAVGGVVFFIAADRRRCLECGHTW
jgi:hypothetical protein